MSVSKFWRYNVNHEIFANMALSHYLTTHAAYIELMNEEDEKTEPDDKTYDLLQTFKTNCIETVCLSVMALESYINLVAVLYNSDVLFDSIERLDIPSKWIVTIQLVAGKELNRGEAPLQRITSTVKRRNAFVHSKSKQVKTEDGHIAIPIMKIKEEYMDAAYDAVTAIADAYDWININCATNTVSICDDNFRNSIDSTYKSASVTWTFLEEWTML